MIKTREDYERLNKAINTYGGKAYQDYKETIEALREVAKATNKLLGNHTDYDPMKRQHTVHVDVGAIVEIEYSLTGIPDWILENGE